MLKITELKKDMDFNKLMGGVLEALKGVASSEYFRLQSERKNFADFEKHLKGFFEVIKVNNVEHPFFNDSQGPKNIVLITSDASFLGKLNISVVHSALEQYKEGDLLTVIGKQGVRYAEEIVKDFTVFPGIDDNIPYESMVALRDYIIKVFHEKKLSATTIIYPHFVSFAVQTIQHLQVFPCKALFSNDVISTSHGQTDENPSHQEPDEEIIIEPSKKSIVSYIVKTWLVRSIHQIFWESKLSEWAARVIHLEKSVNEIKSQDKALRLKYFRFLHQMSDQNIREIFCNRMVLARDNI
jgi:ATP synthase F1 gamma subunit